MKNGQVVQIGADRRGTAKSSETIGGRARDGTGGRRCGRSYE